MNNVPRNKITLTINGQGVSADRGMTVLEAAQAAQIYIPTLCADPDLEPYGGCRLCVVEIEGMRGLPTACTTLASDGMVVHTETPAVNEVRTTVTELLIADHPLDCLTCPQNQQCELQEIAAYLGITEQPLRRTNRVFPVDDSNPFFEIDRNKCIICTRCTRTWRRNCGPCSKASASSAASSVRRTGTFRQAATGFPGGSSTAMA